MHSIKNLSETVHKKSHRKNSDFPKRRKFDFSIPIFSLPEFYHRARTRE